MDEIYGRIAMRYVTKSRAISSGVCYKYGPKGARRKSRGDPKQRGEKATNNSRRENTFHIHIATRL